MDAKAQAADKSAPPVTLEQDRSKLTEELRSMCREHLAPYEVPQVFEFVNELPRSALGKLLKRELRKAPAAAAPGGRLSNGNGHVHAGGNGSASGNGSAKKETE
jgi:acyl-CoA synthetase (AMP-forming)/AMP-acid ligase II